MIESFDSNGNLPRGFHFPTIKEFENRFVDYFSDSSTRIDIFQKYVLYCEMLTSLRVATKQWVGGSYITHKMNPNDIDFVTHIDGLGMEYNPDCIPVFKDLDENRGKYKTECKCDSYFVVAYPKYYPDKYEMYMKSVQYWQGKFGSDRDTNETGIIEFDLKSVDLNKGDKIDEVGEDVKYE